MTPATLPPHSPSTLNAITETIALAFASDPTWQPFLTPDSSQVSVAKEYWGIFVQTAQRYPWTFTSPSTTDNAVAAATVWYPPGATELTADEESAFPEFITDLLGAEKRDALFRMSDLFERAHPQEPHYYLSLLATHPSHRGKGQGMGLLAENLRAIDALGVPSYLESSNPANDRRYEALGYRRHGSIELESGLVLSTMWREPHKGPRS